MQERRIRRTLGSVSWLLGLVVWAAIGRGWAESWAPGDTPPGGSDRGDTPPGGSDRGDTPPGGSDLDDVRKTALYESQTAQRRRLSPYEETVPYITVRGKKHRLDRVFQGRPSTILQCTVQSEGKKLVLKLQQNENLFSGAHRLMYYLPNGTLVTEEESNPVRIVRTFALCVGCSWERGAGDWEARKERGNSRPPGPFCVGLDQVGRLVYWMFHWISGCGSESNSATEMGLGKNEGIQPFAISLRRGYPDPKFPLKIDQPLAAPLYFP
ncbi:uncharacterized protein LOC121274449 [Carcharodon carcharias]|uniref:uncharacterized protein LOC121274449 n=1 Tax=Carcharodon carcharias TaxID=13397 RepID=UPI001B7DC2CB|nr:uncharacterized protein LOC121274449 [Carcharodon carcharias]